ncbi:hypothetical protein AM571_PC01023 (plasmid) [Rhizobium etli 8C-3]|uniref:Uncharacterized protein n=2 Tax=Rhizobium TaxID=379 RepID=A0A4R3QRD7_9HYPH|nr:MULTISPECIES: hypothetical protein [Rhizobium]APO78759.1 hypothetical protein AM571_PC01023 [Rhizobium etli 8C-3]TCU24451.1 hypothetical protein EV130_10642 [Rhizobium azibense]TCU39197.1 hypothetical protein EV129_10342 [Rhizobium azibense]
MRDMTISEMLSDPLIRQLLRADRVSLDFFATLLREAAARVHAQAMKDVSTAARSNDSEASAQPHGTVLQAEAV